MAPGGGSSWRNRLESISRPRAVSITSCSKLWDEHQIYRIDHYLGKETVQNILVLRFANGLFEPIWNRDHIDHVQITVAEQLTVGHRGRFYDATGALRDMVPNHLFQLLSLVAMEPPARFEAERCAVRKGGTPRCDCRTKSEADALRNSRPRRNIARDTSRIETIEDYRKTQGCASRQHDGNLCRAQAHDRQLALGGRAVLPADGQGVAFASSPKSAIKFKQAPFAMFRDTPIDRLAQNFLVLGIQPDECISLKFNAKVPGPAIAIAGVSMTFKYEDYFEIAPSTGYETLIYDCMIGDAILFQRADGIEAGWRVVQPFIDAWRHAGAHGLASYSAGSEGPEAADELLARDGRRWRPIG